jgi:hypothetical protein
MWTFDMWDRNQVRTVTPALCTNAVLICQQLSCDLFPIGISSKGDEEARPPEVTYYRHGVLV